MRSSEERLGDVTIVLTVVGVLGFLTALWTAEDATNNEWRSFFSLLSSGALQALFPAFGAAACFNWMDAKRGRLVQWPLLVVLALCGLAVLGGAVFGAGYLSGGQRGSVYLSAVAYLAMVLGGVALVTGLLAPAPDSQDTTE